MDVDHHRIPAARRRRPGRLVIEGGDRARRVAVPVEGGEAHQRGCREPGSVQAADFAARPAREPGVVEVDHVGVAGRGRRVERDRQALAVGREVQAADHADRQLRQRDRFVGRKREYGQTENAVLVAHVGQVAAVVGDLEGLDVPVRRGELFQPAAFRIMVAKGLELARTAFERLVGHEVHRLAVRGEREVAERGLVSVHRKHLELAARHVDHAGIRLVDRHVLRNQQPRSVRREIQRAPVAAFLQQQPRTAGRGVANPDVAVGAVARGAGVRDLRAVVREQRAAVLAALAVGEQGGAAVAGIEPVQLRELVPALVLAEDEAGAPRLRRRRHQRAQRFGIERQLLAHAQRLAHAMRLAGLGEAGRHQQAAVLGPAGNAGAARVLVAVEALHQLGRDLRHVLAGAVAFDLALDGGVLGEGGGDAGRQDRRGEMQGTGHDGRSDERAMRRL